MNGTWRLELPQPHSCGCPRGNGDLVLGSIWQCDCGQSYRWTASDGWGNYWTPVSERQVRRALKRASRSLADGPTS